jgi:prepilin peptidase CpaA
LFESSAARGFRISPATQKTFDALLGDNTAVRCEEPRVVGPDESLPFAIVIAATVVSAVTDVWRFKVYNLVTIPLLISGLIYHGVVGGVPDLSKSLSGALFGFAILMAPYAMGGMGAGDVKLMSAVGAWLGLSLTYRVFIASAIAAGIYGLVLIVMSRKLLETWVNFQILWHRMTVFGRYLGADDRVESEVKRDDRRRRVIPFAAMVAVGIFATLMWLRQAQLP